MLREQLLRVDRGLLIVAAAHRDTRAQPIQQRRGGGHDALQRFDARARVVESTKRDLVFGSAGQRTHVQRWIRIGIDELERTTEGVARG